jgi:hypothetical protein
MDDAVYRAFFTSTGAKLSDLSDYTVPAPLRDSFRTTARHPFLNNSKLAADN